MDYTILLGILPLILFVIVDSFMGLKAALITAVVAALIEAAFSIFYLGELDVVTGISCLLIVLLSIMAFMQKSSLIFKLQPVILGVFLGMALLTTYWMGYPLLYKLIYKYETALPSQVRANMDNEHFKRLLIAASHYLGYSLIAHAGLTAWAAVKLSSWWWVICRGVGFYLFVIIGMIISQLSLN